MKYSITFASLTLSLVGGAACGGFTEIGQGGGGGIPGGTGGATNHGGSKPTGGTRSEEGGVTFGGAAWTAGNPGTGNASAIGGTAGGGAAQCQTASDCPELGVPCQTCPDGSSACPTVECREGQCVASFQTCASQTCNKDEECPRSLAPCELCDDGTNACPWSRCENGTCRSGIDQCPGSNPCAGKACGERCSTCRADHPCPAVIMFCDEQEQCQLNEPVCKKPICETDADCPALQLCTPCSDGNCAEYECLNGACQFTCESGGGAGGANGGACSAERASCADGETCCAGLQCCAGVPVPPGNEYCGRDCPDSDENIKRDFLSVDPEQILNKLSRLPVGTWAYRTEGSAVRHIGPMAQDFNAAFQVGSTEGTISKVDADGVAFAAIQALNARLKTIEEQNQKLRSDLDAIQRRCGE